MQSVSAAFTAEEKDSVRKIVQNLQVSWHRQSLLTTRTFTIGSSTIGGSDIIGINPGAIGSPGNYRYFDESNYVTSLAWERGLKMPTGGLTKALAEASLNNTSGRFTPRYMGGSSELYTAILPRRPMIINAGFNYGVDITIPEFSGIISDQPEVNTRNKSVQLKGVDYIDYFQNKFLDQAIMFTSQRTDQVLTTLSTQLGMSTAQYDYDTGINIIPFGLLEVGSKFSDIFDQLVEAENGHFYQDESGIFKFENRQHWDSSPYNAVQRIITTSQVINAEAPNIDHLVNVVEVNSELRAKQPQQTVMNYIYPTLINASSTVEMFFSYDDPMLAIVNPTYNGADSYYRANTLSDGTGTDYSASVSIKSISNFAQASKITFQNNTTLALYITQVVIAGRPAKKIADIYYREADSSSVTAYQERLLSINNKYIANQTWAQSYAKMLLNDYSDVDNIQRITIRAIPELQLGDLISWQGRYWRVYDIRTTLSADSGFIQELLLLQRNITTYFRIGIETIGGTARIAP
jgi:hypothetical protein